MNDKNVIETLEDIFKQNSYLTYEKLIQMAKQAWNEVQDKKIGEYHPIPVEEIKHDKTSYTAEVEHEETLGIQDESLDDDSKIADESEY